MCLRAVGGGSNQESSAQTVGVGNVLPQGTSCAQLVVVPLMVLTRESSGFALWFHSHQSETSLGLHSGKLPSLRWSPQPSHINTPFKGLLSHAPHGGWLPDPSAGKLAMLTPRMAGWRSGLYCSDSGPLQTSDRRVVPRRSCLARGLAAGLQTDCTPRQVRTLITEQWNSFWS